MIGDWLAQQPPSEALAAVTQAHEAIHAQAEALMRAPPSVLSGDPRVLRFREAAERLQALISALPAGALG